MLYSEENQLIRQWQSLKSQNAEEAEAVIVRLIEQHKGYIIEVAARYAGRVPSEDLFQAGILGLLLALERYDPDRGVKFLTYAAPWIRQCIARCVRADEGAFRASKRIQQIAREINQHDGRLDTDDVAKRMRAKRSTVWRALCPDIVVSLEDPISARSEDPFGVVIPAEDSQRPERVVEEKILVETVAQAISALSERNPLGAKIIILYYANGLTLQEIGARMGVSRETVRQMRDKALIELRYHLARRENGKDNQGRFQL